jgi:hypothetical protein
MRLRRPRLVAAAAASAVLAAALISWLSWPTSSGVPGADRGRQYIDVKSCLLTGAGGIAGGHAAAAWAGMQDASLATRTMASYQPVTGPATAAAALPYLASLAQRQCPLIVAVGAGPRRANTNVGPTTQQTPPGRQQRRPDHDDRQASSARRCR